MRWASSSALWSSSSAGRSLSRLAVSVAVMAFPFVGTDQMGTNPGISKPYVQCRITGILVRTARVRAGETASGKKGPGSRDRALPSFTTSAGYLYGHDLAKRLPSPQRLPVSDSIVVPTVSAFHDPAGASGQLQYMQAGVGAVDDVDEAAAVDLDVVGLDHDVADRVYADLATLRARVRLRRRRRDEEADLARAEGLANVDGAHAGVEPRREHQLAVEDAGERLVARVRPETAAPGAEVAARRRNMVVGDAHRLRRRGDVHHVDHLPVVRAPVAARLVHQDDE